MNKTAAASALDKKKPLVGITTANHECQHVDVGTCRPCHVPRSYHPRPRTITTFASTKKGMARHERTPQLLKAAMKANEPERTESAWHTLVSNFETFGEPSGVPRLKQYRLG